MRLVSPFFLLFALSMVGTFSLASQSKTDSLLQIVSSKAPDSARVDAYNEIASIWRKKGKMDSCNYYAGKALALSLKAGYKRGEAKALYGLGIVASGHGDYVEALEKFSVAAEIDSVINDKKNLASVLSAMGAQKSFLGDLPGATDYYLAALHIKEEMGDSAAVASTIANLGLVQKDAKDSVNAIASFQRAFRLNMQAHNPDFIDNYYNIGSVYMDMNKDSLALSYFQQAGKFADSLHREEILAYVSGAIGQVKTRMGFPLEAISYHEKSLELADRIPDKRLVSFQLMHIGIAFDSLRQYPKAEEYMLKALRLADSIKVLQVRAEIHGTLANLYEETRDYKKSLFHYRKSIAIHDSILNTEKKDELLRKQMNYDFDKKQAIERAARQKDKEIADANGKRKLVIIYSVVILLVLVFFVLVYVYRLFRVSQQQKTIIAQQKLEAEVQRDQVEKQKGMVEEKNKDITDSINYAKRIQQAIFPPENELGNFFPESFIFFLPRDIVSGDFYWFTEKNGKYLVAAVDCTGHGVPGAFMSMIGNAFLQEIVNERGITRPADILSELRFLVINALKQKGEAGEQQDGMDISLVSVGKKANGKSVVEWAGANNPLWIIRDKECIECQPDKRSIGFFKGRGLPFTNHEIEVQQGDQLMIFSDGFADQFGGPKGKKFKYNQLKEKLIAISDKRLEEQKQILDKLFEEWRGRLEQVDDVLVIGIRI